MRDRVSQLLTTLLELVGLALIVIGVWLVAPPLAFVVAGAGLIGISYLLTRGRRM